MESNEEKLLRLLEEHRVRTCILKRLDMLAPRVVRYENLHKGMIDNIKAKQHADYLDSTLKTTAAVLAAAPFIFACAGAAPMLKALVGTKGMVGVTALKWKAGITAGGLATQAMTAGAFSQLMTGVAITSPLAAAYKMAKVLQGDWRMRKKYVEHALKKVNAELAAIGPFITVLCNYVSTPEQLHEFHVRHTAGVTAEVDAQPLLAKSDDARALARNVLCYRVWHEARGHVGKARNRQLPAMRQLQTQINTLMQTGGFPKSG